MSNITVTAYEDSFVCIEGAYSSSGSTPRSCSSMNIPVEVRRNGVGAFFVHLFGHKKSPQD